MKNFKQVSEGLTLIERHRKDAQLHVIEGEIVVTFPGPRLHPRVRDALRRRGWVDRVRFTETNDELIGGWVLHADKDLIIEWRWQG